MADFTVTLPGGREWVPQFVTGIDQEKCIGCGRCFRACGREVLKLMGINDEGEFVAIEDEDDDEFERKVMTIADAEDCVGCEACTRACSLKCLSHAPRQV
jgi:Nif-specific ferredoxin III